MSKFIYNIRSSNGWVGNVVAAYSKLQTNIVKNEMYLISLSLNVLKGFEDT